MLAMFAAAAVLQAGSATALPAATNQPAAAADAALASPQRGENKLVCHQEQETGSLLGGHKVCHTQRQWDQMSRDAQNNLDAVTRIGVRPHL